MATIPTHLDDVAIHRLISTALKALGDANPSVLNVAFIGEESPEAEDGTKPWVQLVAIDIVTEQKNAVRSDNDRATVIVSMTAAVPSTADALSSYLLPGVTRLVRQAFGNVELRDNDTGHYVYLGEVDVAIDAPNSGDGALEQFMSAAIIVTGYANRTDDDSFE